MPRTTKCATDGCASRVTKGRCVDCRRRAASIRNHVTAMRQYVRRMVDRVR